MSVLVAYGERTWRVILIHENKGAVTHIFVKLLVFLWHFFESFLVLDPTV